MFLFWLNRKVRSFFSCKIDFSNSIRYNVYPISLWLCDSSKKENHDRIWLFHLLFISSIIRDPYVGYGTLSFVVRFLFMSSYVEVISNSVKINPIDQYDRNILSVSLSISITIHHFPGESNLQTVRNFRVEIGL